ncbi:MAG: glycoside hydrolase [Clostridiales bacterium]|nr:glycoside hydrolase [Clostridiales bacterium]
MNRFKYLNIFVPVIAALAVFGIFLAFRTALASRGASGAIEQYDRSQILLIIGADIVRTEYQPIVRDGEIAIDLETVRARIDSKISWDEGNRRVTVTTRDRLIRMNTDELTAFVNEREVQLDLPAFEDSGAIYIPMRFLSDFYQLDIQYNEENRLVIIDDRATVIQIATIISDGAVIRTGRDSKALIVKEYGDTPQPAGDGGEAGAAGSEGSAMAGYELYVFEHYDDWYKVRSADGHVGFIEKKYVALRMYVDRDTLAEGHAPAPWKPESGKISMAWEQVEKKTPSPENIPDMPGLDVVSPQWFTLADEGGGVESAASTEYIEWAHRRGYKVWALFRNVSNDIEMTSAFLNSSAARENALRSLLAYASMLGIDGLNLDFENVYLRDKDALTQFVRELSPLLRAQGLAVSVDVNVPDGSETWSRCYDTPAIADAADYVVVMAYDQHVNSSPNAGSVSQLNWVEVNLKKLIERDLVPSQKIILGIPFYTRVWEMETPDEEPNGRFSGVRAVYMETAVNYALDNGASVEWDEPSGQFYCEYDLDGKRYHMWLEELQSINVKSSLIHKYNLAGLSAWSRVQGMDEIWGVLERNTKDIASYSDWMDRAYVEAPALARPAQ